MRIDSPIFISDSDTSDNNRSLQATLATIAAAERKAKQNRPLNPTSPPSSELKEERLPSLRGVPNIALRTALFGAIGKGARKYLERQEISSQGGIQMVYTGARLDQGDLDVWEAVLHTARAHPLGNKCRVTAYQILKMLNKTDTGLNRKALSKSLSRMKATGIDVSVGRYSYEGSLIDEVYRDAETREYIIRLNPRLSSLFAKDQFTQLDLTVRRTLDGQPLAQWLHGLYASHAKPFPMRMSTLLEVSGSMNVNPRSSRQKLRKALEAVKQASAVHGQRFEFEIKGDLVHVQKMGSKSQARHLQKMARHSPN